MAQTVIGIFEQGIDAQTAVQKLRSSNIDTNNIDISDQTRNSTDTDSNRSSSFFGSLFGDNDDARRHADVARRGWVVTVHSQSREEAERAAELLDECGAVDVDEVAAQAGTRTNMQAGATGATTPPQGKTTDTTGQNIPIMEERLQVGKREVERGAGRIRSRIVEKPVEENLRLREEHVSIERNKVNRAATDQDFQSFKEGEMEITERAEVPVVNKEARVTEEININKTSDVHNETVRDTVRKTEVDIDKTREDDRLRDDRTRGDDPTRR